MYSINNIGFGPSWAQTLIGLAQFVQGSLVSGFGRVRDPNIDYTSSATNGLIQVHPNRGLRLQFHLIVTKPVLSPTNQSHLLVSRNLLKELNFYIVKQYMLTKSEYATLQSANNCFHEIIDENPT